MRRSLWYALYTAAIALCWAALCKAFPSLADRYAQTIFPAIGEAGSRITSAVRWSIAEPLILALLILLGAGIFLAVLQAIFRWNLHPLKRLGAQALCALTTFALLYCALWAPLYARTPAIEADAVIHPSELTALCDALILKANDLRETLAENNRGLMLLAQGRTAMLDQAAALVSEAVGGALPAPKPVRYPELFDALGIAGMYVPFTFEALVNFNDFDFALPFTACHELAHQAGFAQEDEASYIGWLACMAGDADFQYSGALTILNYAMDSLRAFDPQGWRSAQEGMSDAVKRDYAAANSVPAQPDHPLRLFQSRVSEAFLRFNGQREGLKSYSGVVRYVIAHLRDLEMGKHGRTARNPAK